MLLGVIAGIDLNRAIGFGGQLLYSVKDDLQHFRKLTEYRSIIMGRRTFLSLPESKPLPNREHLILSKSGFCIDDSFSDICKVFSSKNELLDYTEKKINNTGGSKESILLNREISDIDSILNLDAYIIGGEEIYKLFLDEAAVLELTEFMTETGRADCYFPDFKNRYIEIGSSGIKEATAFNHISQSEEKIKYQFKRYISLEIYRKLQLP